MEDDLVFEAQNGNHEALAQLLHTNYEIVYRYLLKFTLNKSVTEDLVQETMVRAIEKIAGYDIRKSKFSTWLITIARNIYIDNIRKGKKEFLYGEDDIVANIMQKDSSSSDISIRTVIDALSQMPPENRLPLLLKHYYGYSYEEIAKKMKIPEGTVKSRIHNSLKSLRKEMSK